ncbi:MAG: hypothetical protein Q9218_000197 [Villophora microphyllina]
MDIFQNDIDNPDLWVRSDETTTFGDLLLDEDLFGPDFAFSGFPLTEEQTAPSRLDIENGPLVGQDTGNLATVESQNLVNRESEHANNFSVNMRTHGRNAAVDHDEDDHLFGDFRKPIPDTPRLSSSIPNTYESPMNVSSDTAISHSQATQRQSVAEIGRITLHPHVNSDLDSHVTASTSGTAALVAPANSISHPKFAHHSSGLSQTSQHSNQAISGHEVCTASSNTAISSRREIPSDLTSSDMASLQVPRHAFLSLAMANGQLAIGNPSDASSDASTRQTQSQCSNGAFLHLASPETRFENASIYRMSSLIHQGLMDGSHRRLVFAPDHNGALNTLQLGMQDFMRVIYARMHYPGLMNRIASFIDSFSVDPCSAHREPHDHEHKRLSDAWRNNQRKLSESQHQLQQCQLALHESQTQLQQSRGEVTELRTKLQLVENKHVALETKAKEAVAKQRFDLDRIRAERDRLRGIVNAHVEANQKLVQQHYNQHANAMHQARKIIGEKDGAIADLQSRLKDCTATLQLFTTFYSQGVPQRLSSQEVIARFGNHSNHAEIINSNEHRFAHMHGPYATAASQPDILSTSALVINQRAQNGHEMPAHQQHPRPSNHRLAHDHIQATVSLSPSDTPLTTTVTSLSSTPAAHSSLNTSTPPRDGGEAPSSVVQSPTQIATSASTTVSPTPMFVAPSGYYHALDGPSGNTMNLAQSENAASTGTAILPTTLPDAPLDYYSVIGAALNNFNQQMAIPSIEIPANTSIDLTGDDDATAIQIGGANTPAHQIQFPSSPCTAYQTPPPAACRGSSGPSHNGQPPSSPRVTPHWIQPSNTGFGYFANPNSATANEASDYCASQSIGQKRGCSQPDQGIAPCPRPAKKVKTDAPVKKAAKKPVHKAPREKAKRQSKKEKASLHEFSYELYVEQRVQCGQPADSREAYEEYQRSRSSPWSATPAKRTSAAVVRQITPSAGEPIIVGGEDDEDAETRELAALLAAELDGSAEKEREAERQREMDSLFEDDMADGDQEAY